MVDAHREERPGPATTGRVWHVRVPYAGQWLTSNRTTSYRWGRKGWRDSVTQACRAAKLPTGITTMVDIHVVAHYVGRPPVRDRKNLDPTIKALVDGLVPTKVVMREGKRHTRGGYGLLVDDSDKHVRETTWELRRSTTGQPWVHLTITEVVAVEPCCATGEPEGHAGPCVYVCPECHGSQRCPECDDYSVEDCGTCGTCGAAGGCSACYEGMVTDE
jgi:hypothetical protein